MMLWHLGTRSSGGLGSAELNVALDDLKGPKRVHDSIPSPATWHSSLAAQGGQGRPSRGSDYTSSAQCTCIIMGLMFLRDQSSLAPLLGPGLSLSAATGCSPPPPTGTANSFPLKLHQSLPPTLERTPRAVRAENDEALDYPQG
ncbi:hypothetical protein HGM15179_000311 [Zosterops borbonicus]|uniref:Uncharacterized protein n=1 Tax=Zosterops borbonicus TaxID=364589 RepID=A0A8K1GX60_9PASS|nr:hypothetical protein HGM15179_000311 [Zosterops borbonicus]